MVLGRWSLLLDVLAPAKPASLTVNYKDKNSLSCKQTVSLRRWKDNTWVKLSDTTVGTTELEINKPPGGAFSDYVNVGGQALVKVDCTSSSASFQSMGDLLRVLYT